MAYYGNQQENFPLNIQIVLGINGTFILVLLLETQSEYDLHRIHSYLIHSKLSEEISFLQYGHDMINYMQIFHSIYLYNC